ncbi:hypothetical protein CAOG_04077 [Capsaspora owczarzaki ATCC 30864]|nr:hypothetical protein CAOG_04077 [Capsaspora owczarzaki ATCC 30864]|eukprot:XP_004347902.1 hypothetical protein CAOG_04077 [Capsaspora owczarzaki ATCC 30864]
MKMLRCCAVVIVAAIAVSMVAAAPAPAARGPVDPFHVHFAYGYDTARAMQLSWQTQQDTVASLALFGLQPGSRYYSAIGSSFTYNATAAGYFHAVSLYGLTPDTTYYVVVGDNNTNTYSAEFSFHTLPAALSASKPDIKIAIYGDLGVDNAEYVVPDLINLAQQDKVDFFMHVGDLSYADNYADAQYEPIWEQFMTQMDPIYLVKPYMVNPGNHESDGGWDNVQHPFSPYNARFQMPYADSKSTSNMWYSYNVAGLLHVVAMDTETDFPLAPEGSSLFGGAQFAWLDADLAAAKAAGYKFIIVTGHRPIYSSQSGMSANNVPISDCLNLQALLEPLLRKYGVDMMIVGHVHSAEVTYPVFNNTVVSTSYVNPGATVHVVTGSAGCPEGIESVWIPATWSADRYPDPATAADPGFGYSLLTVNATTLHYEFFRSDTSLEHELYLVKTQ